jgi:hypothetical protein
MHIDRFTAVSIMSGIMYHIHMALSCSPHNLLQEQQLDGCFLKCWASVAAACGAELS